MHYILIVILVTGDIVLTTQEFNNLEACKAAATIIDSSTAQYSAAPTEMYCVPKGK